MNIQDMLPKKMQKQELDNIRKVAAGDLPEPYETHRVHKDGQTLPVWLTASLLVDEAGHVYAMATTQRIAKGRDGP